MPSLLLKAAGINPDTDLGSVKDAGGHPGVVQAVYNGECDAGATFGDARTLVAEDLPDVNEKVVVIATTADIPNDTVAFEPSVPAEIREKITKAMLDMTELEDGKQMYTDLYSWSGLQEVDDAFYDPFRQFLQSAGVDIETFVK
jgi:phosphonate transport system substrate-binding protein